MTGFGGIYIVLIVFISWLLAKALLVAPLALPASAFFFLRRFGIGRRFAALIAVVPVVLFLAWALYGLYELHDNCQSTQLVRSTPEKLGPIDALLIVDGPGMWWMDKRIDIERHSFRTREGIDQYSTWPAKNENRGTRHGWLSEAELRSRYKVTIEPPINGNFWQRYLRFGLITVEERSTGNIVAKLEEPAWGGGLAGSYITALTEDNPFSQINRYLSCGYAGQQIGIFRGQSDARRGFYQSADQNLIDQLFVIN